MSSIGSGVFSGGAGRNDKSLSLGLLETMRLAWADTDLRARITFVLLMFAVFALGTHIPVPIPGIDSASLWDKLSKNPQLDLLNTFGGGGLRRISILALGLGPYITASIIIQVLTTAFPTWKKELQEGGEYARKAQNRRTRMLCLILCIFQGAGLFALMANAESTLAAQPPIVKATTVIFWTAGAMFMLWLGEQISEKGIGNGVSLMIFAGILISLPNQFGMLSKAVITDRTVSWFSVIGMVAIFLVTTYVVVLFTIAQRRIPIQHMRRQVGTKMLGGQTSYLPFSLNMVGVIPIIFASSLIFIPGQLSLAFGGDKTSIGNFFHTIQSFLDPSADNWHAIVAYAGYTALIFFFTYFYTAVQFNVDDIANNLKRGGSFIPGVRPGKQTKDFLDGVISRITLVGAAFLAAVALTQFISPRLTGIPYRYVSVVGGTTLLIIVSVALETLRQIEANLLMKQYNQ